MSKKAALIKLKNKESKSVSNLIDLKLFTIKSLLNLIGRPYKLCIVKFFSDVKPIIFFRIMRFTLPAFLLSLFFNLMRAAFLLT